MNPAAVNLICNAQPKQTPQKTSQTLPFPEKYLSNDQSAANPNAIAGNSIITETLSRGNDGEATKSITAVSPAARPELLPTSLYSNITSRVEKETARMRPARADGPNRQNSPAKISVCKGG